MRFPVGCWYRLSLPLSCCVLFKLDTHLPTNLVHVLCDSNCRGMKHQFILNLAVHNTLSHSIDFVP